MVFKRPREYEDIVQVYIYEPSDIGPEDCRHEPLTCRRFIIVALLKYCAKERAVDCRKCSLMHVRRLDTDLLVRICNVEFASDRA